jgi:hypothetical protein
VADEQDRFAYFLETEREPVAPGHPAWERNLPGGRGCFMPEARPDEEILFTVGDYFKAAREFLERAHPTAAAGRIRVHLAKHGAFYHPAKVAVGVGGRRTEFVLNVAVADAGRALIYKEFRILQRLRREVSPAWIPAVFEYGEVARRGRPPAAMFLGEWLSGFHEFHLTRRGPRGKTAIVVWDPEADRRFLDRLEARAVYAGAARILTHYFNPVTGACIGSWHHAAGDFVVSLAEAEPAVRLITIRDYRPLRCATTGPGDSLPELLESLLLFFLNLSIRMRLDRLDGVGEVVWSDSVAVDGSLDGFLQGLCAKSGLPGAPIPTDLLFRQYALSLGPGYLLEVCRGLLARAHLDSPDPHTAAAHLDEHVAALIDALSRS